MDQLHEIVVPLGRPLSSGLYVLLLLFTAIYAGQRTRSGGWRAFWVLLYTAVFYAGYMVVAADEDASRFLLRIESPFLFVAVVLILPAVYLPHGRWYRLFLLLPAALIVLAVVEAIARSTAAPEFSWFLVRPVYLLGAVVGFLVICQHFLNMKHLRRVTRITMFLVLMYGGFALRESYADYRYMVDRRRDASADVMLVAETVPVVRGDYQVTHLPSAPCRFSADGGYVQGCPMELLQRVAQVDYGEVGDDVGETAILAIALGAVLFITVLAFIGARWWCGWVCPLSSLGDVLDWCRKKLGLPHMKAAQPVRLTYLFSGLSLGTFGLLLGSAYPHIDAQGKFLGCKIPPYPFCKICPGQQVCPIASEGPAAWPGFPTWDWLFGFFKVFCIALLALFVFSFVVGRRLWCRFCPMGMIGGIFNRGGLFALKKDA
ncbi:MAG: 4Fe-4S binding protein, partial [Planctomycetota bacterium]